MPAFLAPLIIAGASAAISAYAKSREASAAKKRLEANVQGAPTYTNPQEQQDLLRETQSRLYARNPAVEAAMRYQQQAAATQQAAAQRNSTSGAEALAVGNAAQLQANAASPGLIDAQTQYEQQNRGQYYGALQSGISDRRYGYQAAAQRNQGISDLYAAQAAGANSTAANYVNAGLSVASTIGQSLYSQGKSVQPGATQDRTGMQDMGTPQSYAPVGSVAAPSTSPLPILPIQQKTYYPWQLPAQQSRYGYPWMGQ